MQLRSWEVMPKDFVVPPSPWALRANHLLLEARQPSSNDTVPIQPRSWTLVRNQPSLSPPVREPTLALAPSRAATSSQQILPHSSPFVLSEMWTTTEAHPREEQMDHPAHGFKLQLMAVQRSCWMSMSCS